MSHGAVSVLRRVWILVVVILAFLITGGLGFAQLQPSGMASPPASAQSNAVYLGLDTATLGNWVGHYGTDGYIIPASSTRLPRYVQLNVSLEPTRISCSDPRCLTIADGSSRTGNEWAAGTSFILDVNLTDGHVHKVSFYVDDFFNAGIIQNVAVKDARSGITLAAQTISDLRGAYQSWEIGGHVTVVVASRLPNLHALVNGMFFDPPPPVTAPSHLIVPAGSRATPLALTAPTDPNYPAAHLEVRVSGLPTGGIVTLADGTTPVMLNQRLSTAQLTTLKFVASATSTTASRFTYTVADPAARHATGNILILTVVATAALSPALCADPAMEAVPVPRDAPRRPASLLVPRSSITPSEIAVLVNDGDQQSVIAGYYFQLRHHVPEENIIHVTLPMLPVPGANFTIAQADFAALKAEVDAQLRPRIQAYAIAWTQPYAVSGGVGITSAFTYGYDGGKGGPPRYFNSDTYQPFTDFRIRPAMMLAGYTPQDVVSLIDRGAAAQQILPSGDGYFIRTTDVARSVRHPEFIAVVDLWNHPNGLRMTYIDDASGAAHDFIKSAPQVLFYETGMQAVPEIASNRYVPGALADHLTSFGGELLASSGQMSVLDWLRAGVTASYGTVTEPSANPYKFPWATVLVARYFGGNTAVEAYNKSVAIPYQGVFVGDPLARPFGTVASLSGGVLSIKTSVLQPGTTYSLLASNSCSGPFAILQSDITAPVRSYATVRNKTGAFAYFELVEN
jgi:uncharacterized protein (TIGR03790 family)